MLYTKIYWNLHDYCKAECSYCPSRFWGGDIPRSIDQYMDVLHRIVQHYKGLGRNIEWTFDGGEPLEMHDLPMMLKYCKENQNTINLSTNGGRKWLDWWAIEPHIDRLDLTYHYWQKENLVNYVIEIFQKNHKTINVIVPIRHDFFDYDLDRSLKLEKKYGIVVSKAQLYKDCSMVSGLYGYTDEQLKIIKGEILVEENIKYQETTFEQRIEEIKIVSPIYTGKLCNVGIEYLNISHNGWVTGSNCNNLHLGNIWDNTFTLPSGPSVCKMQACVNPDDQMITKFD